MSQEFVNRRSIQWFPGPHGKDPAPDRGGPEKRGCGLQLLDARIPQSSLNPELQQLTAGKPRLYVLNKADLADDALTRACVDYFHREGARCGDQRKTKGSAAKVRTAIGRGAGGPACPPGGQGHGRRPHPGHGGGHPNVGKSTFINNFAGEARAKAAGPAGRDPGKQWVTAKAVTWTCRAFYGKSSTV